MSVSLAVNDASFLITEHINTSTQMSGIITRLSAICHTGADMAQRARRTRDQPRLELTRRRYGAD